MFGDRKGHVRPSQPGRMLLIGSGVTRVEVRCGVWLNPQSWNVAASLASWERFWTSSSVRLFRSNIVTV
jgi:hypothetical protein